MDIFSIQSDDFLLRELLGVSAGTWASLIGKSDYVTIDASRDKIVQFFMDTKSTSDYETWQDVWQAYKASK